MNLDHIHKQHVDKDLDIVNILKDIPLEEQNVVLYARATCVDESILIFTHYLGKPITLARMFLGMMTGKEEFRDTILEATLNYLDQNRGDIKEFKDFLNEMQGN